MSDPVIEHRYVVQLLQQLNKLPELATTECPPPPCPDVRVGYRDGSIELFEVTEIHPDEGPKGGSHARAQEMQRARGNPHAVVASWVPADAVAGVRFRVEDKCRKARSYAVHGGETLSLLLVGSIPLIGAVASTYVFAPFITVDRLNAELGENLRNSPFERAYIHLPLSGHGVWGWTRSRGWVVLRPPKDGGNEGRQMLDALRGSFLPGTDLRGARIGQL